MPQPISRDEFDTVKELLTAAARYAESANERLDHASMTIGDNALAITRLEQLVEQNSRSLGRLEQLVEQNTAAIASLTQFVNLSLTEAAADRDLIRNAIDAMFRHQANGGGQSQQPQ